MEIKLEPIIIVENLIKEFKVEKKREGLLGSIKDLFHCESYTIHALKGISFRVKEGEIVGCLGTNGAGKSTLIKSMLGILEPTKGKISVNGQDPQEKRVKYAQMIGVVFGQRSQLWWSLPVIESFKILKDMYKIDEKIYKRNMELFYEVIEDKEMLQKPVRQLSLGQRALCDIFAAFLHSPKIVFLDEPTIGLDIYMKNKIRVMIQRFNKENNTTIILTTHDMGDVDALCERVIIVDNGLVIYDDKIENLRNLNGKWKTISVNYKQMEHFTEEDDINQYIFEFQNKIIDEYGENNVKISVKDKKLEIFIDEENVELMDFISSLRAEGTIQGLQIFDSSTESVIMKIYENQKREH